MYRKRVQPGRGNAAFFSARLSPRSLDRQVAFSQLVAVPRARGFIDLSVKITRKRGASELLNLKDRSRRRFTAVSDAVENVLGPNARCRFFDDSSDLSRLPKID